MTTQASQFLNQWDNNVSLDITPGWEMYHHFSVRAGEWREFFMTYRARILVGMDATTSAGDEDKGQMDRAVQAMAKIRAFLETGANMFSGRGLNLDRSALPRIYCDNFLDAVGRRQYVLARK